MDWKLMAVTFGIVFLAELGDKTQLAAVALTGKSGKPWTVFVGASIAMVAATLMGVLVGAGLNRILSERVLEIGAAALFLGVGVFLLVKAIWFGEAPETPEPPA